MMARIVQQSPPLQWLIHLVLRRYKRLTGTLYGRRPPQQQVNLHNVCPSTDLRMTGEVVARTEELEALQDKRLEFAVLSADERAKRAEGTRHGAGDNTSWRCSGSG